MVQYKKWFDLSAVWCFNILPYVIFRHLFSFVFYLKRSVYGQVRCNVKIKTLDPALVPGL